MATAVEQFGREFDGERATKVYYLHAASSEDDARTTLLAAAAATWEAGGVTLYHDELAARVFENDGIWYGELSYVPEEELQGSGGDGSDSSFEFDTTGGTMHLMASLDTRGAYAPAGVASNIDDNNGLIGVTRDGVEGVDVGVGQLAFTITKSFAVGDVDSDYIADLRDLTYTTNESEFAGTSDDGIDFEFDAGEVLYQGCRGGVRNGRMVISFMFGAARNRTDLALGDPMDGGIAISAKGAWDYMWVKYQDATVSNMFVKTPRVVYVEKVYEASSFSLLGIT